MRVSLYHPSKIVPVKSLCYIIEFPPWGVGRPNTLFFTPPTTVTVIGPTPIPPKFYGGIKGKWWWGWTREYFLTVIDLKYSFRNVYVEVLGRTDGGGLEGIRGDTDRKGPS